MSDLQEMDEPVKLWESAALPAQPLGDADPASHGPVTIHRGMAVQTSEGCVAGHVAAVMVEPGQHAITHVLLVQECRNQVEYRLIPVTLIQQVDGGQLLLRIFEPGIDSLPLWHRG